MRARLGVDGALYLQQHFYELNGRVFQPYGEDRAMYYAYARPQKKLVETQGQYEELKKYFVIEECGMGKDPHEVLKADIEQELQQPIVSSQWLTMHYLERYQNEGVLVGYYKSKEQLQWILGNNDKGSLVYNVRLQLKGEEPREGAHTASFYEKQKVRFVILYTYGVNETGEYRVFHVKDMAKKVSEARMRDTWYPAEVNGDYFFFRFDEEVNIGRLDIVRLLNDLRENHKKEFGSYTLGEPLFSSAENLINYRQGF
jgi:hypothetical protein